MKQNKEFEKLKKEEQEMLMMNEEDDDIEYVDDVEDVEEWSDYMSEELATGYHILTDWFKNMGLPVLEHCTFHDFVEFCYRYSSGRKPIC